MRGHQRKKKKSEVCPVKWGGLSQVVHKGIFGIRKTVQDGGFKQKKQALPARALEPREEGFEKVSEIKWGGGKSWKS